MKRIEAFIHHVRVERVIQSLGDAGFRNIVLHDVRGMLKPITERERDYSGETGGLVISEACLSLVVEDSERERVTALIREAGRVGPNIAGHIYVSTVDEALTIGGPTP